jgi:tryptophanyl-tRNA synthetase
MSIADMSSGIKEGQQKMSKSDPSSAIFMEDIEVISLDICHFLNINNKIFFNNLNNKHIIYQS